MLFQHDTIAAVATPPGEGGLAIIRVSGPDAFAIAAHVFRPRQAGDVAAYAGYTTHYGQFVEAATGEVADDGLLTVFRAPRSFTGEDTIELSCHGGRATTARVLQVALSAGARLAGPGEFTQRAFLNGRMDLAQAEAVADVIRARTEASRRLARRQLDGALSHAILRLKDEMIGILAAIEVTIDFSEEVGELDHAMILPRLLAVKQEIETLLQTAERGRILREGLRVAIVGRPNVGKSSLLNALLRQERAIVTPIAGTTRDLVEEAASIGGIPVVLVDTAGIRDTQDVVERIGVERAQNAASHADIVLFVLDATTGLLPDDIAIARQLDQAEAGRVVAVFNKCDLLPTGQDKAQATWKSEGLSRGVVGLVHVSAQTGEGLEVLEETMVRTAVGSGNTADVSGESVIVANARHQQALASALGSLQEAEQTTRQRLPGDFIVIDVRGALDQLGLITGETVTEDIIHRIFRDFCVGK
jgi:tRNA modification GTPase